MTITFFDTTDTVQWGLNNLTGLSCPSSSIPEYCSIGSGFGGSTTFSSAVNLYFNIYEPDGLTLSDTLQVNAAAGSNSITSTFQSDVDGVPLTPLAGATSIVEDGTVQTATSVALGGSFLGDEYVVRFQSDINESAVPEPRLIALLSLAALGMVFAARRRKLS